KSSTTMTTNSSNTSSAGSHEKVTIQSSKLPETTQSNVQGQSAVEERSLNTDQVSTSTNSGSQTLQEDEEETPIIVPSIMSVLLSILGIVYKARSRGL
ncbi:MAG TPA: iron transporter, partial [Anaerostipes hadrus]|nr:iron transporter [Anaerostipes hadrus]